MSNHSKLTYSKVESVLQPAMSNCIHLNDLRNSLLLLQPAVPLNRTEMFQ
jgi:hypothetical protein